MPRKFKRPLDYKIILVGSLYSRNVGSVSRVMSNMGLDQLILIHSQCVIDYEAQQAAATGQEALQKRTEYSSWDEFFKNEPEGLRIAFTARDGRGRQVQDFKSTLDGLAKSSPLLKTQSSKTLPLYLIFGPEDAGLSAKDLELAHQCCSLPTFGKNWSLNLSHAVLLALYILRDQWGGEKTELDGEKRGDRGMKPMAFPESSLKIWLQEMGFNLGKEKTNAFTTLRRMLLRSVPTPKELRVLEIALQQSTRKLKDYNRAREKNLRRP